VRNCAPAAGKSAIPAQLLIGQQPSLEQLCVFGNTRWVLLPRDKRPNKFLPVSGLDSSSKAFRILCKGNRAIVSPPVEFDEHPAQFAMQPQPQPRPTTAESDGMLGGVQLPHQQPGEPSTGQYIPEMQHWDATSSASFS